MPRLREALTLRYLIWVDITRQATSACTDEERGGHAKGFLPIDVYSREFVHL